MASVKKKRVRYAVVGLGHIAQVAALPGFQNARKNSEVTAFVTGDLVKAQKVIRGKSGPYKGVQVVGYEDYEKLLGSGLIDAVYISLPNDQHYKYAKLALNAGLHVLSEKPFTLNSNEALELQNLANLKKAQLMVAYRLHFEAANLKAIEIAQKDLGELKYYTAHFSYPVVDPNNIRLNPSAQGGGPIWDIGIYCINAARGLFRDEPLEVMAMAEHSKDPKFRDGFETMAFILRFPKNRLAQISCSFGAAEAGEFSIYGNAGSLHLENAFEYLGPREMKVKFEGNKKDRKLKFKSSDQFGPEFHYFSNCILNDLKPEPSGLEGMADTKVIQAVLKSAETKKLVKLAPSKLKLRRPQMKQKAFRPPTPKVNLFRVRSAHVE